MESTILLWGNWADIRDWKWTSNNQKMADMLNSLLNPDGPSPSDPQPEVHEAERIAKMFGAEIIHRVFAKHEPGLVY